MLCVECLSSSPQGTDYRELKDLKVCICSADGTRGHPYAYWFGGNRTGIVRSAAIVRLHQLPTHPMCLPLQDIGRAFWEQQAAKRERKQRLVQIGGHAVLKSNLYDMNQVQLAGSMACWSPQGPGRCAHSA